MMIKPSRLDRIIAAFSPRRAVLRMQDRMRFEALRGGYTGANKSRDALRGWNPGNGDADADIIPDLDQLRENSRDLSRNNPIGAAAKSTKIGHVIGSGLKFVGGIDREFLQMSDNEADAWESDAERRFALWWNSEDSDFERTLKGPDHQTLTYGSMLDNGDHFVLLTRQKRPWTDNETVLQHIEADRVSNENWQSDTETLVAGVERNADGVPILYHVADQHPGNRYRKDTKWTKLPVFGSRSGRPITLHIYDKLRAGQTRGVPHLAPVIELIKQLGRYTDAEVDAAVKNAHFALLVRTATGEGLAGMNFDSWVSERKTYYKEHPVQIKEGSSGIVGLFPDDEVMPFNPDRPNTGAQGFFAAMFEQIGMALEIPYEVLINHFSASWSASQAALMQMWRPVVSRRAFLSRQLMKPVYYTWLAEEIRIGQIAAPGFFVDPMVRAAYCGSEWIGDAKGHINEKQSIDAAERRIAVGVSTRKQETAALTGSDWDKVRKQLEKESRLFTPTEPANNGQNAQSDPIQDAEDEEQRSQPQRGTGNA